MYVYIYICIHVYIYTCIYVYMYIYSDQFDDQHSKLMTNMYILMNKSTSESNQID